MKSSELLRLLKRNGWIVIREAAGSHKVMTNPNFPKEVIIFPDHGSKEVAKGLERKIKKQARLL